MLTLCSLSLRLEHLTFPMHWAAATVCFCVPVPEGGPFTSTSELFWNENIFHVQLHNSWRWFIWIYF